MEPPGEGRYEDAESLAGLPLTMPQWSRPVKGGTSARHDRADRGHQRAAMEPPGEGRYES